MVGFKRTSIKNKLVTIQMATAFIVVLICCIFFVVNDIRTFKDAAVRKMFSLARIAGENAVSALVFMDQDAANQMLMKLNKEPDIIEAVVLDKNEKLFGKYERTPGAGKPIQEHGINNVIASDFWGKKLMVTYKLFQEQEFIGTVILRAELNDLDKIISGYLIVAGLVLFAGVIASLIISYFLQRSISDRLLSLVAKTKEVAKTGNYSLRFVDNAKDEIAILSNGFNNMLEQIEKMQKFLTENNIALKNYSQNLERFNKELEEFAYISSHDMKSPVTSLNGMLTLMEQKDAIKQEHRNLFNMARNSAMQMQKTINALNEIIAFRKTLKIEKEKIDLHEALEEVKLRIYESIVSSGAVITADFSSARHLYYPAVHLKSILQNLLTNAIKYKQEGKPPVIDIKTMQEGGFVVLEVKDRGIGIDLNLYKDKLYGLFQRFHTHIEGMGIGLHMIHSIIESYGGKIYIDSTVNEGTTFKIYLSNVPF